MAIQKDKPGTAADAKKLLESLAKGCPDAHQTKLAKAALERLEKKVPAKP